MMITIWTTRTAARIRWKRLYDDLEDDHLEDGDEDSEDDDNDQNEDSGLKGDNLEENTTIKRVEDSERSRQNSIVCRKSRKRGIRGGFNCPQDCFPSWQPLIFSRPLDKITMGS